MYIYYLLPDRVFAFGLTMPGSLSLSPVSYKVACDESCFQYQLPLPRVMNLIAVFSLKRQTEKLASVPKRRSWQRM